MKKIREWILQHKRVASGVGVLLLVLIIRGRMQSQQNQQTTLSQPVKKGSIVESVYGIGTVAALRSYSLKPGVASTIRKLNVKEGDHVRRGQFLLDLDGTAPMIAPFDGTVTYLPVKMGETVFAQSTVLTITDLQDRYITVSLEQRGALRVKQGQKARISFDSMRDQTFSGVVNSVYSNDSNFLVRIGVQDLPPEILPGMSADVAIGISEHKDALLVPIAALDVGKVYVKREGSRRPAAIDVKTGIVDGAYAEVVSGDIHEGETLVMKKKAP